MMTLKYPTDAEIQDAKTKGRAKAREVRQLVYRALGLCLIIRALTPPELGRVMDVQIARTQRDAHMSALIDATLWSSVPIEEIVRRYPALPGEVWKQVERLAGVVQRDADVHDLVLGVEIDSPYDRALARSGLPEAKLDELAGEGDHALVVVEDLGCAFVMRAPDQVVYTALEDELAACRLAGKGFLECATRGVLEAVAWSSEPAEALLDRWPGLATAELLPVFRRLGGAGAVVEAKSL